MEETLLSVGIDIGTSTTQLVVSRLTLVNRANPFSVPRIDIAEREILYRSGIHFTPLKDPVTIDADGVRAIVAEEYRKAGVDREQVGTGAVIITGETARKENAREVLRALTAFAGDFVVATAGPDLESVLAARGAGADKLSREKHASVLHCDIGGGTSNLALYENGALRSTGCLDVGGRLIQVDEKGRPTCVADKLKPYLPPSGEVGPAVDAMAEALLEAAGLRPPTALLAHFTTHRTVELERPPDFISFSGGVADCMWSPPGEPFPYGDVGALLGRRVREAFEAAGAAILRGGETIRATVVGAGAYSTELSGSTVFYREVTFPVHNLPVVKLTEEEEHPDRAAAAIRKKLGWFGGEGGELRAAVALRGSPAPSYSEVLRWAQALAEGLRPLEESGFFPVVIVEQDMAKALGQALAALCPGPVLVLDGVAAEEGNYVDVGAPVGGGAALPVVIKTLVFQDRPGRREAEERKEWTI